MCLGTEAIFVDDLDDLGQKRIFPVTLEAHLTPTIDPKLWYWDYLWRNVTQNSLECCSDTFLAMHYIKAEEMAQLEFIIYNLHPFGLKKNLTESLPKKLALDQIINASDKRSNSKNYRAHKLIHNIHEDERY